MRTPNMLRMIYALIFFCSCISSMAESHFQETISADLRNELTGKWVFESKNSRKLLEETFIEFLDDETIIFYDSTGLVFLDKYNVIGENAISVKGYL